MAQDQKKTTVGGNTPKPGNPPGGSQGQSAKDRSRAQSRPVSGKAPTGKSGRATGANKTGGGAGGGGGGGNKPRPGGRPAPAAPKRTLSGAMLAWGAVGLVVVIIVALVIVKASGNSNNNSFTPVTPAPASVVHDVTNIPLSVYNTVGVTSPTVPVNPPTVAKNQPPLTLDGKTPSVLYVGAEYCPFCAAERWAITAAMSRFGTWSGLKITASSHTDTDAATNTFSYYGATYSSPYVHVVTKEIDSNVPDANNNPPYTTLQTLTAQEGQLATKYSGTQFFSSSQGGISFPFVSINNLVLVSGASYNPSVLAGQTWQQISSGLSDPTNPTTQAIVATANYITAGVCASTKNAPAAVCSSPGVQAATKALKLG
jgi:Domain of unknown function (DUF929)